MLVIYKVAQKQHILVYRHLLVLNSISILLLKLLYFEIPFILLWNQKGLLQFTQSADECCLTRDCIYTIDELNGPVADKNEQRNTRCKVVLRKRGVMVFPVNIATFIHVYSLRCRFLSREDKAEQRKTWVLSQRQKNATSVLLRFVWRRCMLPGNQKRGIKMTVDTARRRKIESVGLKTRMSWNKSYHTKTLRDTSISRA
jgi:hypothetical protein